LGFKKTSRIAPTGSLKFSNARLSGLASATRSC
jgi:hypothetical protein